MNSDQTMQMPSGPPPVSQRSTCGEYSGERESYGATGTMGYGGIPTSSNSNYGSFGVLSSISSGVVTGAPALPLLLPVPPLTSTFKTTTISMPTSTTPSPLIAMPTPAPSPLLAMPMPTTSMTIPTTTTTTMAPATSSLLPMSMSMSLTTPTPMPTQLLPMPTLEDIEVATQQQQSSQSVPPQQQQQPTGILKYPTASSIGYVSELMPPQPAPPLATSANSSINSNCGTLKSNAKLLPLQLVGPATATRHHSKEPPPGSAAAAAAQSQQRQQRRQGWCACFGSGPTPSEAKTPPGYSTKSKKRKQTSQTVWSALQTNLGICMLLLAYTLLGSFIFLTIENEDSALLHQQHTLASTKRNMAMSGNMHSNGNTNGIYQQQRSPQTQQQQQQHQHQQGPHTDNDTVAAAVAQGQGQDLGRERGIYGQASNDFVYGLDESEMEAGQTQFALSPDTYDVRQRTIENIWDITVSLNILYKENWTKLAALEIAKFQDQLIKRLNEDVMLQLSHDDATGGHAASAAAGNGGNGAAAAAAASNNPATEAVLLHTHFHNHRLAGGVGVGGPPHEWNFAKAFLYSLTVLTTIGYGNVAPRTALGRIVTVAYAFFGIPLTLVYLSSTGSILAKVAREVFSKALCCCLCSNCGYCCYDEKRMAEKERRMKRKRQQEEMRKQQAAMQEPYYVRDVYHATPEKQAEAGGGGGDSMSGPQSNPQSNAVDIDSLSASESRGSMHGLSILAPILLCFSMMIIYIVFGAAVLYRLENWPIIDGIYFCFMSLSTIGFGDMLPGLRRDSNATTWFCSVYIMSGMTLTAMCFNVIHEEIVHRIRIVVEFKKTSVQAGAAGVGGGGGGGGSLLDVTHEDNNQYYMNAS